MCCQGGDIINSLEDSSFPKIGNYSFILDIGGHPLKVTYKYTAFKAIDHPDYLHLCELGEDYHHVSYDLYGKTASPTEYHSHFVPLRHIECPYEYAQKFAEYLYENLKTTHPDLVNRQYSLL